MCPSTLAMQVNLRHDLTVQRKPEREVQLCGMNYGGRLSTQGYHATLTATFLCHSLSLLTTSSIISLQIVIVNYLRHLAAVMMMALHQMAFTSDKAKGKCDLQVLRGARAEVQLCGEAEEMDGPLLKGIPKGVALHTHVIPPGLAGVVR